MIVNNDYILVIVNFGIFSRYIFTNEKCFKKRNIVKLFYDICCIVFDEEFNR